MNIVAYQGTKGSFSYLTAMRLFGESNTLQGFSTFEEAFHAVEKGEAALALLPIENTLAGTIYETLDLLSQGSLKVIGETKTRIEHSLLGSIGSRLSEIHTVYSHPKALAQCQRFLAKHPHMKGMAYYDTAGAAADIAKMGDTSIAAIAHAYNAEIYPLEVLAQGIEDHAQNFTRFFILSKEAKEGTRCSICFMLKHTVGALAEVLSELARCHVNVTYIVSRPLIGKPFEYMFYMDLEASQKASFIEKIKDKTHSLKILGWYHELP
jgi:prephenate dehydratase